MPKERTPRLSNDHPCTIALQYFVVILTGNNRSALNDAAAANKLQPTYMKAILRGEYNEDLCSMCHAFGINYSWVHGNIIYRPTLMP